MEKESQFALQCNEALCIGCQACVSACAFGAMGFADKPQVDADNCRLCGACVDACPATALTIVQEKRTVQKGEHVYVLMEVDEDGLAPVSCELLGEASRLAARLHQRVEALLIGAGVKRWSNEPIAFGADIVHVWEHPALEHRIETQYAEVLAACLRQSHPGILLVGATEWGRGLAARLAAMLRTGLTADCTELCIQPETGLLLQKRPAFGGNLMATIATPEYRPQMASVRPGVMQALERDAFRTGHVVEHDLSAFPLDGRIRVMEYVRGLRAGNQLENSKIVVGIGRGVKDAQTLEAVQTLAARLGATVGASRAAVEAGLLDASVQIGQTGHAIAPDVYIALGISGQIQHVAAIGGAKTVIAVNRDASAPIFRVADYGWVGTVEEALPVLLDHLDPVCNHG